MFKVHARFASRAEVAHVSAIATSVPPEQWRADNPNGKVLAWLPEREGVYDKIITVLANRARAMMGKTAVAEGDVILLRYQEGGFIRAHRDRHMHGKHVRLGILIEQPTMGGELFIDGELVELRPGDAVVYRADEVDHCVTEVLAGERYLLTVGTVFQ